MNFILQRNSNHVFRNSVRYKKIMSKSSSRRKNSSVTPKSEARFIFNIGEDDNSEEENSEDEEGGNVATEVKRIVFEPKATRILHRKEFYIESTKDIDTIKFQCKGEQKFEPQPISFEETDGEINPNNETNRNSPTNRTFVCS